MKKQVKRSALLEIGSEEIPARFIPSLLEQLSTAVQTGLTSANLPFSEVQVFATPRRLAALVRGLPQKGADREEVAFGPPVAASKGPNGEWTQAALGFAKSQNVKPEALEVRESPK